MLHGTEVPPTMVTLWSDPSRWEGVTSGQALYFPIRIAKFPVLSGVGEAVCGVCQSFTAMAKNQLDGMLEDDNDCEEDKRDKDSKATKLKNIKKGKMLKKLTKFDGGNQPTKVLRMWERRKASGARKSNSDPFESHHIGSLATTCSCPDQIPKPEEVKPPVFVPPIIPLPLPHPPKSMKPPQSI